MDRWSTMKLRSVLLLVNDLGGRVATKAKSDPLGTYRLVLNTEGNMLEIRQPPLAS